LYNSKHQTIALMAAMSLSDNGSQSGMGIARGLAAMFSMGGAQASPQGQETPAAANHIMRQQADLVVGDFIRTIFDVVHHQTGEKRRCKLVGIVRRIDPVEREFQADLLIDDGNGVFEDKHKYSLDQEGEWKRLRQMDERERLLLVMKDALDYCKFMNMPIKALVPTSKGQLEMTFCLDSDGSRRSKRVKLNEKEWKKPTIQNVKNLIDQIADPDCRDPQPSASSSRKRSRSSAEDDEDDGDGADHARRPAHGHLENHAAGADDGDASEEEEHGNAAGDDAATRRTPRQDGRNIAGDGDPCQPERGLSLNARSVDPANIKEQEEILQKAEDAWKAAAECLDAALQDLMLRSQQCLIQADLSSLDHKERHDLAKHVVHESGDHLKNYEQARTVLEAAVEESRLCGEEQKIASACLDNMRKLKLRKENTESAKQRVSQARTDLNHRGSRGTSTTSFGASSSAANDLRRGVPRDGLLDRSVLSSTLSSVTPPTPAAPPSSASEKPSLRPTEIKN